MLYVERKVDDCMWGKKVCQIMLNLWHHDCVHFHMYLAMEKGFQST